MKNKTNRNKNDNSIRVEQREKIREQLDIRPFPWTEKQKLLIETILNKDTNMVLINGVAGTAKTLCAVYCALELLNKKRMSDIYYVRTIIESASKSIGAIPGEIFDKFKPYAMPLEDKLLELLPKSQVDKLFKDNRIHAMPVNYLRGASINTSYIIGDELQNFTKTEITTLITRIGKFSKIVLCGDSGQSDLNGKSGFKEIYNTFNDEESKTHGIYCFEFGINDVMRSETVKFILQKLKL